MDQPRRFPFYVGESLRLEFRCKWGDYVDPATGLQVAGGPIVLTGSKLRATCKRAGPDRAQAWVKHNTADGGSDAQIVILDATGATDGKYSRLAVLATANDTSGMKDGDYELDVVAKLNDTDATQVTLAVVVLEMRVRPTVGAIP